MYIGPHKIGRDARPFVIAEMSGNHNQSLERALEIVEAAAATGVQAMKMQTYTADTITLNVRGGDFEITDESSLWKGRNLHDLYDEAHTPWEWHEQIMRRAQDLGMLCFSTPFDESAVDFLEKLNVPAYKIASFESTHLPLIRKVASTGKPMIVSTGMATVGEIHEAVTAARDAGAKDIVLLKCTSNYPASPENTNVLTIPHMRELFRCEVGLSDHTMGVGAAVAAVAHGASVIEKHFTLRRADGGVDSVFSLEPDEMKSLAIETERAWQSLGSVAYGAGESEQKSLAFRQSVYVARKVAAGSVLSKEDLRIVRPGYGLAPKHYEMLIGRRARRDLEAGTATSWDMVMN